MTREVPSLFLGCLREKYSNRLELALVNSAMCEFSSIYSMIFQKEVYPLPHGKQGICEKKKINDFSQTVRCSTYNQFTEYLTKSFLDFNRMTIVAIQMKYQEILIVLIYALLVNHL